MTLLAYGRLCTALWAVGPTPCEESWAKSLAGLLTDLHDCKVESLLDILIGLRCMLSVETCADSSQRQSCSDPRDTAAGLLLKLSMQRRPIRTSRPAVMSLESEQDCLCWSSAQCCVHLQLRWQQGCSTHAGDVSLQRLPHLCC